MRCAAAGMGLVHLVDTPTHRAKYARRAHLLDLALSDIDGVKVEVLPKIADRNVPATTAPLPVP